MTEGLKIRSLAAGDPEVISKAFDRLGWTKSVGQYERYLEEQEFGTRMTRVAAIGSEFAGYATVRWSPEYPYFRVNDIPATEDLNVIPHFRRRGIATALVDECERLIRQRSGVAGIGVGLHPGYNAAQRMYVLRGYIPDGRGVTCKDRYVAEGETLPFDDDLVLYFTKQL